MTVSDPRPRRTDPAPSFILHARAREYEWSGAGQLSLKTFAGGQAHYRVGGGLHAVDDRVYFVVNQGQPYTITIDAEQPVESFCVFWAPGIADEVRRSLTVSLDAQLSDPSSRPADQPFFEQLYPHDRLVSPALDALQRAVAGGAEPGRVDEQLRSLMERLLQAQQGIFGKLQQLQAARPATRAELYRRLVRARDFMAASYDQPLALDEIAAVACLSPNHLLRSFRQLFGMTPHQLLTERRVARARELLASTDLPVVEIALAVGFSSATSFSGLFRRHVGCAPAAYRRQTR